MPLSTVTVIGAGTMGAGIAQVAAMAAYPVRLYDVEQSFLDHAISRIEQNLTKGIARGKVSSGQQQQTLQQLSTTTDLVTATLNAGIVIEAIPELLKTKQQLFCQLDTLCPAETLLCSNTSSIRIADLAAAVKRPQHVLGTHFFNPVHIMPLLEIVITEQTNPGALQQIQQFAAAIGKQSIVIRDFPGFATSRLGVCIGLEAIRMLEQGVASAEDIDKAMTLGYGHPMGPLKLTDLVGLDVRLQIADYLDRALPGASFKAPQLLRQMVKDGRLGKKSGQGFYRWK